METIKSLREESAELRSLFANDSLVSRVVEEFQTNHFRQFDKDNIKNFIGILEIEELKSVAMREYILEKILDIREAIRQCKFFLEPDLLKGQTRAETEGFENAISAQTLEVSLLCRDYRVLYDNTNFLIKNRLQEEITRVLNINPSITKKMFLQIGEGESGFDFAFFEKNKITLVDNYIQGGD